MVFTGTTYGDYTIDLDNVPTTASRVVFLMIPEFPSGYTYGYNYAYIDDVEIRDIPNCPEPTNIVASATSDTSYFFSWNDSSVVSSYRIEWGPQGFSQGTGILYDTVIGNQWTIDTLLGNTTYEFYIQSLCPIQGFNSPWYGPISVTTPCSPTAAPFADGFENSPGYSGNSSNPNLPAVGLMTVLTVLHTLWVTVIRTTRIQVATHCTTTCTWVVVIPMLFPHQ